MNYLEKAIQKLKAHGYKITPKRTIALQYIQTKDGIISPYSFVEEYPQEHFDKVTLYRFFDLLVSLHLLQKIHSLNGYVRTDGDDHKHHHYFLVCADCQNLDEQVVHNEKNELASWGVYPINHSLEIIGLCKNCKK